MNLGGVATICRPERQGDDEADGSRVQPRRGAVPRRVPRLARGQRAAPRAAVRRHARGLRRAPRMGADALRRRLRRRVVAGGVRRSRRVAVGVADLRGGVLPRPARRSGSRRTASSCSRRRSSSSAPQEQKDRILPQDGGGRTDVVPGLVGAERGQRPRRHPVARPCATTRRAAGGSPARRRGRHAARSARTSSGCSAAIPTPSATAASRTSSSTSRRRASRSRPVERLDGDEGFAEVFLDDVFVPDADVLGEPNQGWGVAMATTGSERGLTLRSPGRFLATAQRLIDLYHADARATTRRCATGSSRRGSTPRRTAGRRSGPSPASSRASAPGAESSLVKVFWSELDVAAARARARAARSDHAELRRRRRRGVDEGLPVRARGPDLRGHQRDPAQRRSPSASSACRGSSACGSPSPTTSSRSATRCATSSPRSARPRTCATRGRTTTGRVPGLWDQLVEMGVRRHARARSRRRARARRCVDLVLLLEETGPLRGARADRRDRGVRRAAARPRRPSRRRVGARARAVGRHRRRRSSPPPGRFERADGRARRRARRSTAPAACSRCAGTPTPVDAAPQLAAFDRGVLRHRRAAVRAGRPHARDDRRLREGAQAVRRAGRLVPGGEAPPRQRAHRARVRPPARVPRRGRRLDPRRT